MRRASIFGKLILMIMATFTLASCLSPVKTEIENKYSLTTVPAVKHRSPRKITILVTAPDMVAAYKTTQMAYTTTPYKIAYYGKNRWISTPAQMLQPLIVQTLQDTHYFHAVVTPPVLSRYDYLLNTQIIEIQLDFTHSPATFNLVVNAQLSRAINSQIIAAKQFEVYEPMPDCTPYGGVFAGNQATSKLLRKLAEFTIKNAR